MRSALVPLLVLALAGCAPGAPATPPAPAAALPSPPPWAAPADARARIQAAGLEAMSTEAFEVHVHAHLDVSYNGAPVAVPASIGIGADFISPLHTHLDSGVVHIEAPTNAPITLGQFFTEWNVPLDGAKAYVNGVDTPNPAAIVLADHQQIAVVFGTPPATIPASYSGAWR